MRLKQIILINMLLQLIVINQTQNNITNKLQIQQRAQMISTSAYTKPLYQAEKQFQYHRHVQRLKTIALQRHRYEKRDSLQEMHKIRNKSAQYKTHKQIQQINRQNQKLLNKLIQISRRKTTSVKTIQHKNKILSFKNPQRKRRQLQIASSNSFLAQRLLLKQSDLSQQKYSKQIQDYQKLKQSMMRNKRIHLAPLQKSRIISLQNTNKLNSSKAKTTIDVEIQQMRESLEHSKPINEKQVQKNNLF